MYNDGKIPKEIQSRFRLTQIWKFLVPIKIYLFLICILLINSCTTTKKEEIIVPVSNNGVMSVNYTNPDLYLNNGEQTSLSEKNSKLLEKFITQSGGIEGLILGYMLKEYFVNKAFNDYGFSIGKKTSNEIFESGLSSGCHDNALILASVYRQMEYPVIMVDTVDINWAININKEIDTDLKGMYFLRYI